MGSSEIQPKKRGANSNRMTPFQRMFVEQLAADPLMKPTNAVRNAGSKSKNPSQLATKMLKMPMVRAYLGKVLYERMERLEITKDDVLKFLWTVLYLDPYELFEKEDGVLVVKDLEQVPIEIRRCIKKLKVKSSTYGEDNPVTKTEIEIELMDKDAALALAMRHMGMFEADNSQRPGQENSEILSQLLNIVEQRRSNIIDAKFVEGKVNGS